MRLLLGRKSHKVVGLVSRTNRSQKKWSSCAELLAAGSVATQD